MHLCAPPHVTRRMCRRYSHSHQTFCSMSCMMFPMAWIRLLNSCSVLKWWNVNKRFADRDGQLHRTNFNSYKKLKLDDPTNGLMFCEYLLTMFEEDESLPERIIFSFIRSPKKSVARVNRELQMPESTVAMPRRYYLSL